MSVRLVPLVFIGLAGLGVAAVNRVNIDVPEGLVSFAEQKDERASRDPGTATSRTVKVGAYRQLRVLGPYKVEVAAAGDSTLVRASGGARVLDNLDVRVEDDTLVIEPKKNLRWSGRDTVTITIAAPALQAAMLAGSGEVRIARVAGDFTGEVAGSGRLDLAGVAADQLDLTIAGSGDIEARGQARSMKIAIAGSGDVAAEALKVEDADVSIAGSGDVRLFASRTADITTMGSGDVAVLGGARCDVSKAGSGDVEC